MSVSDFEAQNGVIPIEIRPGLVVRIQGIPFDLTPDEARKIVAVVTALAQPATSP